MSRENVFLYFSYDLRFFNELMSNFSGLTSSLEKMFLELTIANINSYLLLDKTGNLIFNMFNAIVSNFFLSIFCLFNIRKCLISCPFLSFSTSKHREDEPAEYTNKCQTIENFNPLFCFLNENILCRSYITNEIPLFVSHDVN